MEKSEFLSFFYKHCMHMMTAPLFAATAEERPSKGNDSLHSVFKERAGIENSCSLTVAAI